MADNNTILEKLEGLVARFEEVSTLITDPAVIADQKRYVKLTKEYKELGDLMDARKEYIQVLNGIEEAKEIITNEADPEMREMAREELMPVRHASRNWKNISSSSSCLPTHRTVRTPFSKSAGYRWRRSRNLCRRPLPHVYQILRNERLEDGNIQRQRRRSRRIQGNYLQRYGR